MHVKSVLCLSSLIIFVEVSCYDNITMSQLSKDMVKQLNTLRLHEILDAREGCKRTQPVEVKFLLYTRNSTDVPVPLQTNNTQEMDFSKKMVLLIHGWLSNPDSPGMSQLKDMYLKRYDCNVVMVDWSQMAWKLYTTAHCHTTKVSNYVAKLLCELNLTLSNIHVVGHGMGAQVAGVVGQLVNIKCKQRIGRITGLDPAGPLFQGASDRRRLDKSDANFVDVIHTDQMKFGYSGNIGHVDFHPNCGQHQPGCPSLQGISDITPVSDVFCSHHRSLEYMIESIAADAFVAVSCGMCPRSCRPDMISEKYAIMGEGAYASHRTVNKFLVNTNSSPPYGQGWALYNAKLP